MEQRGAIHIFIVIKSELEKYGTPTTVNIRNTKDFIISYDTRNRIPYWVLEIISLKNFKRSQGNTRKGKKFTPDKTFNEMYQSTNKDYYMSGYDRGHMAAAGNYLHSSDLMGKTFILSNIAPQVGKNFNQGIWNQLEENIRSYIKKSIYKTAHILTGPLFIPKKVKRGNRTIYIMEYETLMGRIAVPTHFFKVIIFTNNNNTITYQSYIMPNEEISGPIYKFLRNISDIENYSGFRIFPKIDFGRIKMLFN
uniref:Endonuclease n=1 Tax=Strongyloides stercoralis TaxID=6248 RepID=A0A0K0EKJ7_STRER